MYHSIFKETLFFFIFFIFKMRTFTIYDLKKKINIYFNNLITDTSSYLNCKYKMFQILKSTHEKKNFHLFKLCDYTTKFHQYTNKYKHQCCAIQ